jgi:tRNA modification GTPase
MFSTADTIVAIATPPGRGGLGVVRLSGPEAVRIAGELVGRTTPFGPRHATLSRLARHEGSVANPSVGDAVVVTVFPQPASYTGDDVAEISAHGSPVVLTTILRRAVQAGARLAEPGEFTLRAFLNGKIDLVQAEAVADLIEAVTPLQARAAFDQLEGTLTCAIAAIEAELFDLTARLEASLDFPDEGYHFIEPGGASAGLSRIVAAIDRLLTDAARGRLVREGAQVVILGAPNVGKSSLFNALLNANRAIVTPVPGTTRDLLIERAEIGGLSLALVDTAGVRPAGDIVEEEGVARTRGAMAVAELAVVVLDRSRALDGNDRAVLEGTASRPRVIVLNKIDLPSGLDAASLVDQPAARDAIEISVRTGEGLERLPDAIERALTAGDVHRDPPMVTNLRHVTLLERARSHLMSAAAALDASKGTLPEEFLLADLQEASLHLQEITGRRTADDVLRHIFQSFCVGK